MLSLDDFRIEESLKWEVMEQTDRARRHRKRFLQLLQEFDEYDHPRLLNSIYRALDSQVGRHMREANARQNHARYQLELLRRKREAGLTAASMPPIEHSTISAVFPRQLPWSHPSKDLLDPSINVGLESDDIPTDETQSDAVAETESGQDPHVVWEAAAATTQNASQTETEAPIAFGGVAESEVVNSPEFDEATQSVGSEASQTEVVRPALPPFPGNEQREPSVIGTDSGFLFSDSDVSAIDFGSIRTEPLQSIPLGTPGTDEEVAALVTFLPKQTPLEVCDANQTDRDLGMRSGGNATNGTACGPPFARTGKQGVPTYH